jgi:hypothetical protein
VVTAVEVEHRTLSVRRSNGRELTIDTTHYEAIDRGYALTVHKAQGMTADVALVVGSDGATREWAYTAMSRATVATHYYDVERPTEGDRLGVHHAQEAMKPSGERIAQSWNRSVQNDNALDYPERYQTLERRPGVGTSRLFGSATEAQRSLLADFSVGNRKVVRAAVGNATESINESIVDACQVDVFSSDLEPLHHATQPRNQRASGRCRRERIEVRILARRPINEREWHSLRVSTGVLVPLDSCDPALECQQLRPSLVGRRRRGQGGHSSIAEGCARNCSQSALRNCPHTFRR